MFRINEQYILLEIREREEAKRKDSHFKGIVEMPAVPVVVRRIHLVGGGCRCSSRTSTTTEMKPFSCRRRRRRWACGGRRLGCFWVSLIELLRWLHGGTAQRIVFNSRLNVYQRRRNYCWGFIGFINASRIFRLCNVNSDVFTHIIFLSLNVSHKMCTECCDHFLTRSSFGFNTSWIDRFWWRCLRSVCDPPFIR